MVGTYEDALRLWERFNDFLHFPKLLLVISHFIALFLGLRKSIDVAE